MDLTRAGRISDRLSAAFLEHHGVLPLAIEHGRLRVATWLDEVDVQVLDDLRLLTGAEPVLDPAPERDVRAAIHRVYGVDGLTAREVIESLPGPEAGERAVSEEDIPLDDLRSLANEAPVVRVVNLLLLEALAARASDVHLEGHAHGLQARYRIDGVLQDAPSPPAHLKAAIVSRLKIMADLDIAERRMPQDGRIRLRLERREVDVRVSTLPTLHGESVVLRLLDREQARIGLAELGMAEDTLALFGAAISRPHGIVLVTGPTGSGKTTTLYGAVDRLRTGREKILTVEDPVEYELQGANQVQVQTRVGLTFAAALRALLRQDPDILLVGEIRDEETAEIAIHAALTGHLVLSTLHTNDAPGALTRLLDLGVPEYLVSATVDGVLAQRLVRRVCARCAVRAPAELDWGSVFGTDGDELRTIVRGTGCEECRGTGFRGRTGIYEFLALGETERARLLRDRGAASLRKAAVASGMRTLRQDGVRQVLAGCTTPEEVLRVTTD